MSRNGAAGWVDEIMGLVDAGFAPEVLELRALS
jgi:hypothetical protein